MCVCVGGGGFTVKMCVDNGNHWSEVCVCVGGGFTVKMCVDNGNHWSEVCVCVWGGGGYC